jgi:hypothetical protein
MANLGFISKKLGEDFAKNLISDFIGSLGAEATANFFYKDFGKRPGDKTLMEKVKDLFGQGKRNEAAEVLLTARPGGEGQADEAINLNTMTNGLRRFQGGKYAAQADDLAVWFASQTPEFREKFRLTWVLLDPIQRIETYIELALMTPDIREAHIKQSGILDNSIAQQKLIDDNERLRRLIDARKNPSVPTGPDTRTKLEKIMHKASEILFGDSLSFK